MAFFTGLSLYRSGSCLGDRMRERAGRFLLLFLTGHLCCVSGFELARAWDFFRVDFRPLSVLVLLLAYSCAAWMAVLPASRRPMAGALLVAWVSVAAFPLVVWAPARMVAVGFLGAALCCLCLRGRMAGAGFLCSLLMPAALRFIPDWTGALLLVAVAALELRHQAQREPNWTRGGTLPEGAATRAEIYWKGFATLYRSTAPGEGQKFKESVVGDTLKMIRACGGKTKSSSDNRAL
ncbi:MAG: hypothetical protein KC800_26670, partial [Candidatus Eremiobacteraeota bacterium]|nr:hypothetical protein [Candidatus Eremiobacteraeota bacterium]